MARYTDRWGLSILGAGDSIQDEGYKFADADRRLIDRLLAYAAEQHRHTGAATPQNTPLAGLNLTVTTGGSLLGGNRYYYQYTNVDPSGYESTPSPMQSIDLPQEVNSPQAPSPVALTGTGDLLPGSYSYVCSAYLTVNTLETKALNSAAIRVPGSNLHNSVQMTLPDLPMNATGLNVYRKTPNGLQYLFLTSIPAPTHAQVFVDDGSVEEDCNRTLPAANRTSSDNMVLVVYPGATPTVTAGWSWNIYRTTDPNDWGRSYLASIGPQGVPLSTPTVYPDTGVGTQVGGPPAQAQAIVAPPKINLTNGAEVQGELPPGRITAPHLVTFRQPGSVTAGSGTFIWMCEYDDVQIATCRAYLAVGSVPAVTPVIVDINASRPSQSLPAWTSIFSNGPSRPRIEVGQSIGDATVPIITSLKLGDMLSVDVDQAGGGATPTDRDLVVSVLFYARSGSTTVSYLWP
jgi:hypothetical protein